MTPAERLDAVRRRMNKARVDALLVQSTDRFLNEYVPTEESTRVWLSGFTGSMGQVVLTDDFAYLLVDGRYWLQGERQTQSSLFEVVRVPHGTGLEAAVIELLQQLQAERSDDLTVGFEPDRVTVAQLERIKKALGDACALKPLHPSPVEQARGVLARPAALPGIRAVNERRVGATVGDKLGALRAWLEEQAIDGLLVQRLDDIAYLSNLRGTEIPYQATFKSVALATPEALVVALAPDAVPDSVRAARPDVRFVPERELWTLIGPKSGRARIGYDAEHNTEHGRQAIEHAKATAVRIESPVAKMKAKKTPAELRSMKAAFRRADQVVDAVIRWACARVQAGHRLTEAAFADRVRATFEAHGAVGLSFKVISAAGKNGAIIHYSEPSGRRVLKEGELMLLDTGAYFAEGYATDLTRTFVVGGPKTKATAEQRRYYTLVLKAAIAGMRAVVPEGTRGGQLDALVRAPLWAEGLNYAHGTGHGVGINVHESPPRIAPGAQTPLEPGHVFSIEPGIYLPKFGGVRIENLCTVRRAPRRPGFLEVVPLTFSPLDKRLIESKLLSTDEKEWLRTYERSFKPAAIRVDGGADARPAPTSRDRRRGATPNMPRRKAAARRPR